MDHEEDEFRANHANDTEELVDDVGNLESDCASKFGRIPTIGMTFNNDSEAYQYYDSYARSVGFRVRKQRLNRNRRGVLWKRIFTCCCEGSYRQKKPPKKKREEKRFGCKAMMEIRLNRISEENKFVVTNFIAEHTHDLVPVSTSHLLRSQRSMEPCQAGFINQMHSAEVKPSQRGSNFNSVSREVTCGMDFDLSEEANLSNTPSSSVVQELSRIAQRIITRASNNNQMYTSVKSELLKIEEKLGKQTDLRLDHDETNNAKSIQYVHEDGVSTKLQNPEVQKPKGRGSGRLKNCLEYNPKKKASTKRKDINSNVHESSRPSSSFVISQGTHFPCEFPVVATVHSLPNHPIGYRAVCPVLSNYSFMYPQENSQPRPQGPALHQSFSNPSTT